MSEKPHCKGVPTTATCCSYVKFCYSKDRASMQFLMALAAEVMESKQGRSGSNVIAGFSRKTAMKMQEDTASCTVGVGPCIK
jgi:hypothetical protein